MVNTSDLDAEGPWFDPWQQLLVQLSRDDHDNRVGAKLTVEAQLVIAENMSVVHCVIPLGKGLVPNCSIV